MVISAEHGDFKDAAWYMNEELRSRGYEVITSKEDLENIKAGDRVWGKLPNAYYDIKRAETTPNLAERTKAAIRALDDGNENGFFLMVEGCAVDGGGHNNNAVNMVSEYLAFDKACEVAIEYAKERTDTVVVIMPDHDTGGIDWDDSKLSEIVTNIQSGVNSSYITWETTGHTNRNGGIFMYAPEGAAYPDGIDISKKDTVMSEFAESDYRTITTNLIDNTDIPKYLSGLINFDFDSMTNELFVDVTDKGTYNAETEVFSFNDYSVGIKRNTSKAYINGKYTDLDGEIALWINDRFYVPQSLLDIIDEDGEAADEIEVYADYNTRTVRVNGFNPKLSGGMVAVSVKNPQSEIVYFNQVTADVLGGYSVKFTTDYLSGDYTMSMNYYSNPTEGEAGVTSRQFTFKNLIPQMSVKKSGTEVTEMTQLEKDDILDVTLSGFDFDDSFKGVVIIAQYDESGVLSGADYLDANGGSVEVGTEITKNATVLSGTEKIKIMYWNKTTYAPITASYIID